jgi:hypothetical protein
MQNKLGKLVSAIILMGGLLFLPPLAATAGKATPGGSGGIRPMATGGVNVSGWCNWYYGGGAYGVVLNSNDAYSWRCNLSGSYYSVNMSSACRLQYGSWAYATFSDVHNPWSWYCVY